MNYLSSKHVKKKQERQERLRKLEKTPHKGSSESITDACSITSSRVSRPWIRDPVSDAKPVTDPLLRQKLQVLNAAGTRLGSRDQKLLQVMIAKREAERKRQEERETLRRKWEEEQHGCYTSQFQRLWFISQSNIYSRSRSLPEELDNGFPEKR
ncbi:hypothetical protein LSH36_577g03087 [Paralvinella palmiformis]|uniref:Uncharacterized protein n=1 Tax=Paralvinella palmiformis TaxID=53620 RepID=A0AAD9J5T1_9ANNE|nr:hypothetical protein LSH36_577g03087 [Paralvinella palmiformis]